MCDVLGTRPFIQSGTDAVRTLLADFSQAPGGVLCKDSIKESSPLDFNDSSALRR